jgi:hypothetical protein
LPTFHHPKRVYALVALAQLKAIDANPKLDPSAAAGAAWRPQSMRPMLLTQGARIGKRAQLSGADAARPVERLTGPRRPPPLNAALAGHAVLSALFPWSQSAVYDGALKAQLEAAAPPPPNKAQRGAIAALAAGLVRDYYNAIGGLQSTEFAFPKAAKPYQWVPTPGQTFALYPQLADAEPLGVGSSRLAEIAFNKDAKAGPVFQPPTPRGIDYDRVRREDGCGWEARLRAAN